MDRAVLKNILSDMSEAVEIMNNNLDDIDVLKFYAGNISILNKELMSLLVKAK